MKTPRHLLAALAMSLVSCAANPLPGDAESYDGELIKSDGWCVRRHQSCKVGGTSCCSGFCADTGYGTGVCSAPLADGSYCTADAQCRTRVCKGNVCGATCVDAGKVCSDAGDCCAGSFCDSDTYGTWRCRALRADGAYCTGDAQCKNGHCVANRCASAPACAAGGASCQGDLDCCAGSCDFNPYLRSWHTCVAPQADGSFCSRDRQCTSGHCENSLCSAPGKMCAALGKPCADDVDCCAGFCENATYAPWVCTAPAPLGAFCFADNRCQSGLCLNYVCASGP
jgi:hypothetical protein